MDVKHAPGLLEHPEASSGEHDCRFAGPGSKAKRHVGNLVDAVVVERLTKILATTKRELTVPPGLIEPDILLAPFAHCAVEAFSEGSKPNGAKEGLEVG